MMDPNTGMVIYLTVLILLTVILVYAVLAFLRERSERISKSMDRAVGWYLNLGM